MFEGIIIFNNESDKNWLSEIFKLDYMRLDRSPIACTLFFQNGNVSFTLSHQ